MSFSKTPIYGEDQADDQEGDDEYPEDGGHLHHPAEGAVAAVGILGVPGGVRIDHASVDLISWSSLRRAVPPVAKLSRLRSGPNSSTNLTMIDS